MDLMLELTDARHFSAKVPKFLKESRDLPPIAFDAIWEEWVRKALRYSYLIVATFPMSPPIQALHTERWNLLDERMLEKTKKPSSTEAKIIALQFHMAVLAGEEVNKRKYIKDYVVGKECYFGVGAKWRMLVIERLPG
jgi:hypothetical protein